MKETFVEKMDLLREKLWSELMSLQQEQLGLLTLVMNYLNKQ
jgi:hypothetical protein